MGPDLGGVIISTSEQEIPMDSFKRKEGELLEEFKYQVFPHLEKPNILIYIPMRPPGKKDYRLRK